MIKVERTKSDRVCQGDIFRDIEYIESVTDEQGVLVIEKIRFPLVIVLTQDCDLAQDYGARCSQGPPRNEDKVLVSVLVAPLYNAEHVYAGTHLGELGMQMEPINKNKSPGDYLRKNDRPRYHFLEFPADVPIVDSVIDFKHYFSANVEYLKEMKRTHFVRKVADLYREDISQRFAAFLARIGLP